MTLRRTSITLALEREVVDPKGAGERVRLGATFEVTGDDPTADELRSALGRLRGELDGIAGAPEGARTGSRPLDELVETYRPRQAELIDLLQEDGEVSDAEAALLHGYLGTPPPAAPVASVLALEVPPPSDRPIAAMPLENDRAPSIPRPVAQLLDQYRIESLKQAGAVRARRQISFEEYMALKRHFSAGSPPTSPASVPEGGSSEPHPPGGG